MQKKDVKLSLVAFIDILGFAQKVLSIKTFADIRRVEGELNTVQKEFISDPKDKWEKLDVEITGREVFAFSDCIVYSVPLSSDLIELQGTFDALMSELNRIALAQATSVLKGIFIRGGIDIGPWFRRADILISPAHVKAYRLEQTTCFPVIAVSEKTYRHFVDHPDRRCYAKGTDGIDFFFDKLRIKGKEIAFLDYAAIALADAEDKSEAFLWLGYHKKSIEAAMGKATDKKVIRKYRWIVKYHNKHVKRYGRAFASLMIS